MEDLTGCEELFAPYRSVDARDAYFDHYDRLAARLWPAGSEVRYVETSFGPTYVRVTGPESAPPLVLMHGVGITSLMWAPNIAGLAGSYRTYAIDTLGDLGRSLCRTPPRRRSDLLRWLDAVFDALSLRAGINLVGISYGGWITAEYALHAPERLGRVVLLAPGATVMGIEAEFWLRTAWAVARRGPSLQTMLEWLFQDLARQDPAWIESACGTLLLGIRSLRPRVVPLPRVFSGEDWRRMRVPALFVVGENEKLYRAEKALRRLECVAPQVKTLLIAGAGHDLTFVEAQSVNQAVMEFIGPSG